jgi:hypothetical protein
MHGSFLFPLIVFVIVLISKLKAAAQQPPPRPPGTPPRPRAARPPGESEEERYRRFMEAVGLPPGGAVPPPVKPRAQTVRGPLPTINPPADLPMPGRLKRVPPLVARPALQPRPQTVLRRVPADPAPAAALSPAQAPEPVKSYFEAITPVQQVQALASTGPAVAVAAPAAVVDTTLSSASSLLARLRDPGSIRQAIILREILGPPKALQG